MKPSRIDAWTKYRYYTEQDIVRLNTVRALQAMDLSLQEIGKVLAYDDLEKIVEFLDQAEKKADEKIAALEYSKAKIQAARADYQQKLESRGERGTPTFLKECPQRVILLSSTLETPTLENLWNYLGHFYAQIPPERQGQFAFEDQAGVYQEKGSSRLFALCTRHGDMEGLIALPGGRYLCAGCSEETRAQAEKELLAAAQKEYGVSPAFVVALVVVSGILYWEYELQVYVGPQELPGEQEGSTAGDGQRSAGPV